MVITKNVAEKTATKTPTTGAEIKTALPNDSVKLPEIVPVKKEETKTAATPKKALPTFEEKLDMLEELNNLVDKRELVRTALKNIADFYISPSGNCSVKMTDSNNHSFSISHPFVIEEILKQVTFKLEEELDKVETMFENIF